MATETLKTLALEILKAKCDLTASSEKEILNCYFNILKSLKEADKELPNPSIRTFK